MVDKYFSKKAIAYQPGLTIVFKSHAVGILLNQLLFWHEKGSKPGGWVYKTIDEMRLETGLSRSQQDTAIEKLKSYEILETKLAGIPAKRHFRLDFENLLNLLPRLKKSSNLAYMNPPNTDALIEHTITKNTQRLQSKNTQLGNDKEIFYKTANKLDSIGDIVNRMDKFKKRDA